jgi:phosphatidylinositol alpha-mannosyltransferase
MRIVQVSAYGLGRYGGVQSHVHDLAAALRSRGHLVRCIGPGPANLQGNAPGPSFETLGNQRSVSLGGTKFEFSYVPGQDLRRMLDDLAEWNPDLVHFHGLWVPLMPWQLFSRLATARVVTFHDTTAPGLAGGMLRSVFRPLGKVIANRVDAAVAVSTAPLVHLGPASKRRAIRILPPTVDLSDFLDLSKPPVSDPPVILHWGRLDRRKNIGTLLEAARLIHRQTAGRAESQRPLFVIAGDGTDSDLVRAASRELGPSVILHLPPQDRQGLLGLLKQARLCVFPAGFGESFGIVLAESLASGTPVLAGHNAGFAQLLGPEGADLMFDSSNPRQLSERVMTFLDDPEGPAIRGKWGRVRARQFDVSSQIGNFESIYAAAIDSRRSKLDGSGYQA